ncbi:MAG: GNAT family N-acetyltransferase [Candidatus Rokuibacteriota bacterium]
MRGLEIPERIGDGPIGLRLPRFEDVPGITAACQDPEIARWTRVPSHYTERHAREFVAFSHAAAEAGGAAQLAVVNEADQVVGSCGVANLDWDALVAEVGYWVAASDRRRGVAVTAVRLLSAWAFESLALGRLELRAAEPNVASNRVAVAAGFTLEGTLRGGAIEGHTGDPSAPRIDLNLYGLLPSDLPPPTAASLPQR